MSSLHEELVQESAFNKKWQKAVKKWPISDDDNLVVFNLIYFLIPIQSKFKSSKTENFQRLCFRCLINFLHDKSLDLGLKELNRSFDDLLQKIAVDPNDPSAKKLKTLMNNIIVNLYINYPAKKPALKSKL